MNRPAIDLRRADYAVIENVLRAARSGGLGTDKASTTAWPTRLNEHDAAAVAVALRAVLGWGTDRIGRVLQKSRASVDTILASAAESADARRARSARGMTLDGAA